VLHIFLTAGVLAGASVAAALTPVDVVTGAPVLGQPGIRQDHKLVPASVVAGAPVLPLVVLRQDHGLVPVALQAGAPVVGQPAIRQDHALVPQGIVTGAPAFDALRVVQNVGLVPLSVTCGAPIVGVLVVRPTGRRPVRVGSDQLGRVDADLRPLPDGGAVRGMAEGSVRSAVPAPMMRRPTGMQVRRGYSGGRR
jgi:hypothetical protein